MSRAQAHAFVNRWKAVEKIKIRELHEASMETKFQRAAALMEFGLQQGWGRRNEPEVTDVRNRWIRLKRALSV